MRRRTTWLLAAGLVFTTCTAYGVFSLRTALTSGWRGPLRPPTGPWGAADLVGTWSYRETCGRAADVAVTFHADGTFTQTVQFDANTPPRVHAGKWSIRRETEGGLIDFDGFIRQDADSYTVATGPFAMTWEVLDSQRKPGQLAVYGSVFSDPDCFQELARRR